MKSTYRKTIKYFLALSFALLCLLLVIAVKPNSVYADAIDNFEKGSSVTQIDIEDDFADDLVTIFLTKDATREFLDYTAADFTEVSALSVDDLTSLTVDWVEKKVRGISMQEEMSIDVEKYRRILSIKLAENSKQNVINAVSILQKREDVELASPSYAQKIASVDADDTFIGDQWGLDNINANSAWNLSTGSYIKVGVLDTGIDGDHPDLKNNIYEGMHRDFTYITNEFPEGIALPNPRDDNGHGTHVAGIIGAAGNNQTGVSGIAWNIKLVSLQVLDSNGASSSNYPLIRGIQYAMANRIKILNYSGWADGSADLSKVIETYTGLFITAAGNNGKNNTEGGWDNDTNDIFPANYRFDNLISVGSIDRNNARSTFSNWASNNETIDIWAPGTDVLSTWPTTKDNHDSDRPGYRTISGTSMSAPHVTGVAALVLSADQGLTPQQLKSAIIDNADTINISIPDPGFWPWEWNRTKDISVKKLNAYEAVKSVSEFNTRILQDDSIEIVGSFYPVVGGSVNIPTYLNDNRTVTSIAEGAFSNQLSISDVTLPNTIQKIGERAFENCFNLTNIDFGLGSQLKNIEAYAFYRTGLSNTLLLPRSIVNIGESAFELCVDLKSVLFMQNSWLDTIGNYAFKSCFNVTNIMIPEQVANIGVNAFAECTNLNTINYNAINCDNLIADSDIFSNSGKDLYISLNIGDKVESIPSGLFENLKIKELIVPNSVEGIEWSAFSGCNQIENISLPFIGNTLNGTSNTYFGYIFGAPSYNNQILYLPTSLKAVTLSGGTSIGDYAFYGCTGLVNISFTDNATVSRDYSVENYIGFTDIIIASDIKSIGDYAFYGCTGLRDVTIPGTVKTIGSGTFSGCNNLETVNFENDYRLSSIGAEAFYNCENVEINIPSNIIYIGELAFYNCNKITKLALRNPNAFIEDNAFTGTGITRIARLINIESRGINGLSDPIQIILTFDKEPIGLTRNNITLENASPMGELSGSGNKRAFYISSVYDYPVRLLSISAIPGVALIASQRGISITDISELETGTDIGVFVPYGGDSVINFIYALSNSLEEQNLGLSIRNAKSESSIQYDQMKEMIDNEHLLVIIVWAVDSDFLQEVIMEAQYKGIYVIELGGIDTTSVSDCLMSVDYYMAGCEQARYLIELSILERPELNRVYILVNPFCYENDNYQSFRAGLKDVFAEYGYIGEFNEVLAYPDENIYSLLSYYVSDYEFPSAVIAFNDYVINSELIDFLQNNRSCLILNSTTIDNALLDDIYYGFIDAAWCLDPDSIAENILLWANALLNGEILEGTYYLNFTMINGDNVYNYMPED